MVKTGSSAIYLMKISTIKKNDGGVVALRQGKGRVKYGASYN